MTYYRDEILEEVRERRAHLLEKYGGFEGYMKHLSEDRPRFEKEGWHFAALREVATRVNAVSDEPYGRDEAATVIPPTGTGKAAIQGVI